MKDKIIPTDAKPPKMEAVAKLAGVSMMTVSRVLNGQSNVRSETRRRVEDAVRIIGYSPNLSARSLASSRSQFIGLAYLNPSSGYLGQFLIGALASARKAGLHLILESCSTEAGDWCEELIAFCKQSQLRGLVLPPPLCDDPNVLAAAIGIGLPTVRVSPSKHVEGFTSIRIDEHLAALTMTNLLIENGHRRIGFLKGAANQEATVQRYAGFVDAMNLAGLEVVDHWVKDGEFKLDTALSAGKDILRRKDRPTAIFASNDDMAAGLYAAAHQVGLVIPNELSVVGFDDQPIAKSLWPTLTTVHQPIVEMAAKAVDVLFTEASGNPDRDQIFQFEIVKRKSHRKL